MKKTSTSALAGYAAILVSMLLWGLSFVWTKHLLNSNFPVFTIVTVRLSIASLVFVSFFKWRGLLEKIRREDLKDFVLLSFFEPFLYFIGENFGLKYVDASFAAVIIALIPILVSVTMFFVESVPIRWEFILGAAISLVGVGLLSVNPDGAIGISVKGVLLLCVALVAAVGYSVLLNRLVNKYRPLTVTTYQNLIAIPFYLPFMLAFDMKVWPSLAWDATNIFCLVCLAILCSAGAYMLYSYSVKQLTVTKVSVFTNLIPIVTLLVAAAIGQETFSNLKLLGIVVVVAGVMFSQTKIRKRSEIKDC
ncbi:MAG: DMT family transporter [Bacteroidales bacterium]|nr:DMT family transporter [Bacteroidales bacterium]